MKVTDFVFKGNKAYFSAYKKGVWYFTVSDVNGKEYEFQVPTTEEFGDGEILKEMSATMMMRWIRKSIEAGVMVQTYSDVKNIGNNL